jgi:hypothetical protein
LGSIIAACGMAMPVLLAGGCNDNDDRRSRMDEPARDSYRNDNYRTSDASWNNWWGMQSTGSWNPKTGQYIPNPSASDKTVDAGRDSTGGTQKTLSEGKVEADGRYDSRGDNRRLDNQRSYDQRGYDNQYDRRYDGTAPSRNDPGRDLNKDGSGGSREHRSNDPDRMNDRDSNARTNDSNWNRDADKNARSTGVRYDNTRTTTTDSTVRSDDWRTREQNDRDRMSSQPASTTSGQYDRDNKYNSTTGQYDSTRSTPSTQNTTQGGYGQDQNRLNNQGSQNQGMQNQGTWDASSGRYIPTTSTSGSAVDRNRPSSGGTQQPMSEPAAGNQDGSGAYNRDLNNPNTTTTTSTDWQRNNTPVAQPSTTPATQPGTTPQPGTTTTDRDRTERDRMERERMERERMDRERADRDRADRDRTTTGATGMTQPRTGDWQNQNSSMMQPLGRESLATIEACNAAADLCTRAAARTLAMVQSGGMSGASGMSTPGSTGSGTSSTGVGTTGTGVTGRDAVGTGSSTSTGATGTGTSTTGATGTNTGTSANNSTGTNTGTGISGPSGMGTTTTSTLGMNSPSNMVMHHVMLEDCAELCHATAKFMARGSDRSRELGRVTADVARTCADHCDRMAAGDPTFTQTAEACRRVARALEGMPASGTGTGTGTGSGNTR